MVGYSGYLWFFGCRFCTKLSEVANEIVQYSDIDYKDLLLMVYQPLLFWTVVVPTFRSYCLLEKLDAFNIQMLPLKKMREKSIVWIFKNHLPKNHLLLSIPYRVFYIT